MANTKSAAKRARQTIKRTLRNRSVLSALKTQQKRTLATFPKSTAAGDKAAAGEKPVVTDKAAVTKETRSLISELDSAVKRGVIHKNVANRRKSRLAKKLAAAA